MQRVATLATSTTFTVNQLFEDEPLEVERYEYEDSRLVFIPTEYVPALSTLQEIS